MEQSGIKTYSINSVAKDVYKVINNLVLKNIKNKTVPYTKELPLPQDVNVVSGWHLGDVNKIQLELKAAEINAKSLKWIFAADATLLGLELKPEFQGCIIGYGNVRGKVDAQPIFLLDQFTQKSIENALSFSRIEENSKGADKQKKIIAQNMIKNISEYDSGIQEIPLRENKRKNIAENYKKRNILAEITETFNDLSQNYDENQNLIFRTLNVYYIKQETGLALGKKLTPEEQTLFLNSLEKIAAAGSPKLLHTLSDCLLYSERLTHSMFTQNRIYTQDDWSKKLNVTAPQAAQLKPRKIESPSQKHEISKLRDRDRTLKPRQIQQRG